MKIKKHYQSLIVLILLISCSYRFNIYDPIWGLLMMLCVSSVAVYIHELGHYIAARLFGYKPLYFIAGVKGNELNYLNSLFKFKLFGTYFILNPLAQGGSLETFTYMDKEPRLNMAIISLAGSFANLFFVVLVFILNFDFIKYSYENGILHILNNTNNGYFLVTLIFALSINFVYFLLNLLPFKSLDGWFLVQLFKKEKSPDFYDIEIHKEGDKELVNEKTFNEIIKPMYDKYLNVNTH